MIGILMITHGRFGEELINSATSIIGKQENITSITLPSQEDINTLKERLIRTIDSFQSPEGVLVLTDMYSTTACNLAFEVSKERNIEIVSGVNLPMLIAALTKRQDYNLIELKNIIIESGKKNIVDVKSEKQK